MKKNVITLIFLLGVCYGFLNFANGQETNTVNKKANALSLEKNARERLEKRLQLLVTFQKSREYDKLFELLTKNEKETKDSFIKLEKSFDQAGRAELIEFSLENIFLLEPDNNWAIIKGCGQYKNKHKNKSYESNVEAVYENNDWYFSSLIVANVGFGRKAKKCFAQ